MGPAGCHAQKQLSTFLPFTRLAREGYVTEEHFTLIGTGWRIITRADRLPPSFDALRPRYHRANPAGICRWVFVSLAKDNESSCWERACGPLTVQPQMQLIGSRG